MLKVLLFLGTCAVVVQHAYCQNTTINQYMLEQCRKPSELVDFYHQIRVQLSTNITIAPNTQCQFTINTDETYNFMLFFRDVNIPGNAGGCPSDYLEVFDGFSTTSKSLLQPKELCGYNAPSEVYNTTESSMTFKFHSGVVPIRASFDLVVTPYHTGACGPFDFTCANGRCIDKSLTCSGFNPCGDHSDCKGTTTAAGKPDVV